MITEKDIQQAVKNIDNRKAKNKPNVWAMIYYIGGIITGLLLSYFL